MMEHGARALRLYSLAFVLTLFACTESPLQPSAASHGLSEDPSEPNGSWAMAQVIPAFQHPALASFDDRIVLLAEHSAGDWLAPYEGFPVDMWEWDGSAWSDRSSPNAPHSRLLPGLTTLRDKLVMVGGFSALGQPYGSTGHLNETWEWDGVDWTQIYPLKSPPGRSQVPLVTWHDQVLMFGGQANGAALNDTWTWNARDWIQQKTEHAPEFCNSPAAAVGGKVIMFCSARDQADHEGHTWEWDGADWHERTPHTRPSNRYSHTLASFGDGVVMYGGYADSGNWQETWLWDGSDWTDLSVQPSPPPHDGYQTAQLATDLVLYGGGTNETWAWNGTNWRIVAPQSMPIARSNYALSAVGDKVILFGGCCKSGADGRQHYWDDTWQWDGRRWTQLAPTQSPPGRAATVLVAIDAETALLFGGVDASGVLADTWQWDAQHGTWIERTGVVNPPARQRHAMAALAGNVLLFGGAGTPVPSHEQALGDTWECNGDTWQRLLVDAAAQTMPAPDYDLALGNFGSTLTLFSGDYNTTASWIWDGGAKAWSQLNVEPPPEPLQSPVYVTTLATAQGQRLILSGNSPWNGLTMTQWDGSAWSWFPVPPSASFGDRAPPLASLGGALVTLTGSPQRTYVYTSR